MVYLLILLLIFGLVQSFLELRKEKKLNRKWSIKKLLSLLYILGFIVGFIVIVWQNSQDNQSSTILENISFSVNKIDSTSEKQIEKLTESLNETKRLIMLTDSMNERLSTVVGIRNSLVAQIEELNKKLAAQISNDKKLMESNKPILELIESDMKWIHLDSNSRGIEFCIRNMGNRSAFVTSLSGNMLFFDKNRNVVYTLVIPYNSTPTLVQPTAQAGQRLCPNIAKMKEIERIFDIIDFAALYVVLNYSDIVDNSPHHTVLYSGWTAAANDFTKLRDWQLEIVKEWIKQNDSN